MPLLEGEPDEGVEEADDVVGGIAEEDCQWRKMTKTPPHCVLPRLLGDILAIVSATPNSHLVVFVLNYTLAVDGHREAHNEANVATSVVAHDIVQETLIHASYIQRSCIKHRLH